MTKKKTSTEENTATASLKHVRMSSQKARMVVNLIRGKQVEPALQVLRYSPKKGSKLVEKLLRSAIANARERKGLNVDKLWVSQAWANAGPTMKRYMPRARGSADGIRKRSTHITVVVEER